AAGRSRRDGVRGNLVFLVGRVGGYALAVILPFGARDGVSRGDLGNLVVWLPERILSPLERGRHEDHDGRDHMVVAGGQRERAEREAELEGPVPLDVCSEGVPLAEVGPGRERKRRLAGRRVV